MRKCCSDIAKNVKKDEATCKLEVMGKYKQIGALGKPVVKIRGVSLFMINESTLLHVHQVHRLRTKRLYNMHNTFC